LPAAVNEFLIPHVINYPPAIFQEQGADGLHWFRLAAVKTIVGGQARVVRLRIRFFNACGERDRERGASVWGVLLPEEGQAEITSEIGRGEVNDLSASSGWEFEERCATITAVLTQGAGSI
jgi:hypothetical protein